MRRGFDEFYSSLPYSHNDRLRNVASAPGLAFLRSHLQRHQNTPVIGQGCAASLTRFSEPDLSIHTRSLADFITITFGFKFPVHTSRTECGQKGRQLRISNNHVLICQRSRPNGWSFRNRQAKGANGGATNRSYRYGTDGLSYGREAG